jgi:hypothetical protein
MFCDDAEIRRLQLEGMRVHAGPHVRIYPHEIAADAFGDFREDGRKSRCA